MWKRRREDFVEGFRGFGGLVIINRVLGWLVVRVRVFLAGRGMDV